MAGCSVSEVIYSGVKQVILRLIQQMLYMLVTVHFLENLS